MTILPLLPDVVLNCSQVEPGLTIFHVALHEIEKSCVPPSGVKVIAVWFTVSSGGALFVFTRKKRYQYNCY